MITHSYEVVRHGCYCAVHQRDDSLVVHQDQITALCRALYEAAGLPWPEVKTGPMVEGSGGASSDGTGFMNTTPTEDRDWVPEVAEFCEGGSSCHCWEAETKNRPVHLGAEGPAVMTQSVGHDLSGLKAAFERVRREQPGYWTSRNDNDAEAIDLLFREAESAGLLTDERPADPVEVVIAALEDIRKTAHGARVDGFPISARWVEYSADIALAALRQGRKG